MTRNVKSWELDKPGKMQSAYFIVQKKQDLSPAKEKNILYADQLYLPESGALYPMDLPQDIRIEVTRSTLEKNKLSGENEYENIPANLGCTLPTASEFMPESIFYNEKPDLKQFKSHMEKKYLEEIIRYTKNDIQEILQISGLSRSHFYALLKKNRISPKAISNGKKKAMTETHPNKY